MSYEHILKLYRSYPDFIKKGAKEIKKAITENGKSPGVLQTMLKKFESPIPPPHQREKDFIHQYTAAISALAVMRP